MRRTKEDAEQTRKDLLQAAEYVFGKKGYAATRLSDIAIQANVTRGAIYHHFGNKKELFIALNKERVDPYFKVIQEIFGLPLTPKQKIKRIFTDLIGKAAKDIDFVAKQRFDFIREIEVLECEGVHKFIREQVTLFHKSLQDLIGEGQQDGDIRKDISPELAAFNLIVYLKGLTSVMVIGSNIDMIRGKADELVENALKGF